MGFSFDKICQNIIPKGSYKAHIADINFKTSSTGETTNDMVVKYMIAEGEYAKRIVIDNISEKAFSFRLKPFLKAAGVDTAREFSTARELYNYGIKEAKGKTVLIDVGTREYNGNTYNQVTTVSPVPSSTTTAEEVLEEFGMAPEVMSSKPKVTDIENLSESDDDDDSSPIADVDDNDLPF